MQNCMYGFSRKKKKVFTIHLFAFASSKGIFFTFFFRSIFFFRRKKRVKKN